MSVISYVVANTRHGAMIVNRFDYASDQWGNKYGVGHQLLNTGSFEAEEIHILRDFLAAVHRHRGDNITALDIGANIGVISIEMSRAMSGWGKLIAFEPQDHVFYALCGNIAISNCFNTTAKQMAVSNYNGYLSVPKIDYTSPASYGSLEIEQLGETQDIGQKIDYSAGNQVTVVRLDDLDLDRVGLIKIDIEGMELKALEGAQNVLEKWKPILFIEHAKSGFDPLFSFLKPLGYKIKKMREDILCIHADDPIFLEASNYMHEAM